MVKGTRPVTAELALLFGRALRQTPQYWLNLQAAYDLKAADGVDQRSIGCGQRAGAGLETMLIDYFTMWRCEAVSTLWYRLHE